MFVDEAIFSAKTLKKYNPKLQTTLFTSVEGVRSKYFDNIVYQPPVKHPQKYKIENMINSPYDFTLYLDSDTMVTDRIYELFDFLLIYDMGFTHRVKARWSAVPEFVDYIDETTIQGGFVLFKKSKKVKTFLKAWYDLVAKNKDEEIKSGTPTGDQIPLNILINDEKLLEKLDIKYVLLPNKVYNARPWMWTQLKKDGEWKQVKIFHAHNLQTPIYKKIVKKIVYRIEKRFRK